LCQRRSRRQSQASQHVATQSESVDRCRSFNHVVNVLHRPLHVCLASSADLPTTQMFNKRRRRRRCFLPTTAATQAVSHCNCATRRGLPHLSFIDGDISGLYLRRPRERLRNIVMSLSVCVSVCPRGYLRNHMRDLYQIFVHVAYVCGSVLLRHVEDRPHCLSAGRG